MAKKAWVLVVLILLAMAGAVAAAMADPGQSPAPALGVEQEIPIIWDVDPATAQAERLAAAGAAEQPLTEWTALSVAVELTGTYRLAVGSVYGEAMLEVEGEGDQRYSLSGSDPLWVSYEGPAPARLRLYGREWKMAPAPAENGGLARYETGQVVIPAGVTYRADMVNVQPYSGVKAAMVCATWGGADWLRVVLRDAASGSELGYADLTAERPCSPIWGRVNRPFTAEVVSDAAVQLYDLVVR